MFGPDAWVFRGGYWPMTPLGQVSPPPRMRSEGAVPRMAPHANDWLEILRTNPSPGFHRCHLFCSSIATYCRLFWAGAAPRLFAGGGKISYLYRSLRTTEFQWNIVLPPQPHLSGGKLPPLPYGGAAHAFGLSPSPERNPECAPGGD